MADEWGQDETGNLYYKNPRLPTHTCTVEELGLVESDYMIAQRNKDDMELYHKKFLCVDEQELYIRGEYSSKSARSVSVNLEKCHDRVDCKSDEEITNFIRSKYLI